MPQFDIIFFYNITLYFFLFLPFISVFSFFFRLIKPILSILINVSNLYYKSFLYAHIKKNPVNTEITVLEIPVNNNNHEIIVPEIPVNNNNHEIIVPEIPVNYYEIIVPGISIDKISETSLILSSPIFSETGPVFLETGPIFLGTGLSLFSSGIGITLFLTLVSGGLFIAKNNNFFSCLLSPFRWIWSKLFSTNKVGDNNSIVSSESDNEESDNEDNDYIGGNDVVDERDSDPDSPEPIAGAEFGRLELNQPSRQLEEVVPNLPVVEVPDSGNRIRAIFDGDDEKDSDPDSPEPVAGAEFGRLELNQPSPQFEEGVPGSYNRLGIISDVDDEKDSDPDSPEPVAGAEFGRLELNQPSPQFEEGVPGSYNRLGIISDVDDEKDSDPDSSEIMTDAEFAKWGIDWRAYRPSPQFEEGVPGSYNRLGIISDVDDEKDSDPDSSEIMTDAEFAKWGIDWRAYRPSHHSDSEEEVSDLPVTDEGNSGLDSSEIMTDAEFAKWGIDWRAYRPSHHSEEEVSDLPSDLPVTDEVPGSYNNRLGIISFDEEKDNTILESGEDLDLSPEEINSSEIQYSQINKGLGELVVGFEIEPSSENGSPIWSDEGEEKFNYFGVGDDIREMADTDLAAADALSLASDMFSSI